MESQHTPGPWVIAPDPGQTCPCGENIGENHMIASHRAPLGTLVGIAVVLSDERETANARLIAAAPELLKQLKIITESYERILVEAGYGIEVARTGKAGRAREAIALAEGGAL